MSFYISLWLVSQYTLIIIQTLRVLPLWLLLRNGRFRSNHSWLLHWWWANRQNLDSTNTKQSYFCSLWDILHQRTVKICNVIGPDRSLPVWPCDMVSYPSEILTLLSVVVGDVWLPIFCVGRHWNTLFLGIHSQLYLHCEINMIYILWQNLNVYLQNCLKAF